MTVETNDAPILDQLNGQWQKILIVVLHKLSPNKPVRISAEDFEALARDFPDRANLFTHGMQDAMEFSVIGEERAKQLRDFQELQNKAAKGNPQ